MTRAELLKKAAENMGLRPVAKVVSNYTLDRNGNLVQVQFERTR